MTALREMDAALPPTWANNWNQFKIHFNLCFQDWKERERAVHQLLNDRVVQTTSARKFIDLVMDTCRKAGWNDQLQWLDVARNGLKREIVIALTGRFPTDWGDFVRAVIDTDEDLQRAKEKKATSHTTTKMGDRPDNSKYKLTEEERKEHMEMKLCYKCHQPNCNSKRCKNPHTVYSDFKKGRAQVAKAGPRPRPQKTEGKAKIPEVKVQSEYEMMRNFLDRTKGLHPSRHYAKTCRYGP